MSLKDSLNPYIHRKPFFIFDMYYVTMSKADVVTCFVVITDKRIQSVMKLYVMLHV